MLLSGRKAICEKDDAVNYAEVNTGEGAWQVLPGFSGVEEHGMSDMGNRRQTGRPGGVLQGGG